MAHAWPRAAREGHTGRGNKREGCRIGRRKKEKSGGVGTQEQRGQKYPDEDVKTQFKLVSVCAERNTY